MNIRVRNKKCWCEIKMLAKDRQKYKKKNYTNIINSTTTGAMQHIFFKLLLQDGAVFEDLITQTEVTRLSKRKVPIIFFTIILPKYYRFFLLLTKSYRKVE